MQSALSTWGEIVRQSSLVVLVASIGSLLACQAAHSGENQNAGRGQSSRSALENQRVFDKAVGLIAENFYDPSSLKSKAAMDHAAQYRSAAGQAKNVRELYEILNRYLRTFGVSHLWATPNLKESEDQSRSGSDGIRRLSAGFGVVRVGDRIVVSGIVPGSSADAAGVRSGWSLKSIDGIPIAEALEGRWAPSGRESLLFVFLDEELNEQVREVRPFAIHGNNAQGREEPPPRNIGRSAEVKIPTDVRYVKLSSFTKAAIAPIDNALHPSSDNRGAIVDLRGNLGGNRVDMLRALGKFLPDTVSAGYRIDRRNRKIEMKSKGRASAGSIVRVVLLVDGHTSSSAEILCHVLKLNGRATVIGNVTAGQVLGSKVFPLLKTGEITIPVFAYLGPTGSHLEGKGVTPDILVDVPSNSSQAGGDVYIEAALMYLAESQLRASFRHRRVALERNAIDERRVEALAPSGRVLVSSRSA